MKPKWKPWLVLGAIFLAGLLSGVGLSVVLAPRFMHPPHPGDIKRHVMNRLTHDLDLTSDQQAKIEPIVEKSIESVEAAHVDEVARVSQIMKDSNAQIEPLLTPEQKTRLDQLEAQREKIFAGHLQMWGFPSEMHPNGGPPPPNGPDGGPPPPNGPEGGPPPPPNGPDGGPPPPPPGN